MLESLFLTAPMQPCQSHGDGSKLVRDIQSRSSGKSEVLVPRGEGRVNPNSTSNEQAEVCLCLFLAISMQTITFFRL